MLGGSPLPPSFSTKANFMANPHKAKGRITVKPDKNGKTQLGQMKPNKKSSYELFLFR